MGWDDAREKVSQALSLVRARDVAARGTNTTLEIAILEAIVDLDSAQTDAVDTLGAGNLIEYSDDGNVRPGRLQQLDALEVTFFGEDRTGKTDGLFVQLRELPDPESEAEGL